MNKNQWASRLGFIMATVGAAIGLGNLWKFPYLMGSNGGFYFLITYLIFILILGIPVMLLEMSIGRKTGKDPVESYKSIHPKAKKVGSLGVWAAFIILSYYSVVGGWILKYFFNYITKFKAPDDFATFISNGSEPVIWHFIFMLMTAIICFYGIKGIEKASTIMMPSLFVLLIIIIIRGLTLDNSISGIKFIFLPGESKFSLNSISAALGQVFYSLSLCMGITITYGSYLNKKENLMKSAGIVAVLDTFIAVLAGIAIFPAVFSFGLEPGQGPSLIFGTLPKVFSSMSGGIIFAIVFFILIFFAAITSAIALLEVVISYTINNFKWSRRKSVIILTSLIFLLGIPSALSFGTLSNITIFNYSLFDFVGMITDNILLPLGGLFMCYYIGWKWDLNILVEEIEGNNFEFKLKKLWIFCIKFITPILIAIVTFTGFIGVYRVVFG